MQLKCTKKICAVYREGAVTDQGVKNGLWGFVLQISDWMMLHGWVDQLKLIEMKLKH